MKANTQTRTSKIVNLKQSKIKRTGLFVLRLNSKTKGQLVSAAVPQVYIVLGCRTGLELPTGYGGPHSKARSYIKRDLVITLAA